MLNRYAFCLQVRPDRLDGYRRSHAAVWPEMLLALREAGWVNYSLFLREDGLLVGYVESDDFDAARARMDTLEVNDRWQAAMADFVPEGQRPDQAFHLLDQVFHLEDQLALLGSDPEKD